MARIFSYSYSSNYGMSYTDMSRESFADMSR
jgi:hypothetical protein